MSKVVDERVVEMRFDNKEFESNVKTSMTTLQKLKQSLKFDGATKGLENVSTAAKKVNLSSIGDAIGTVQAKFSVFDVVAGTVLSNITNSAVNAGKRIISALAIDPIKTGFQEYETQINAIQTILANTESKGSTLNDVNSALDELNRYADMTIYNFTQMTRNIGTFTAAGVDLDTSVAAIKGIANLAAVSGSTSQQASTAMYQLSQALAAGTVKLMDWNSVVNAGMGGQVFQDALKETARVHNIAIDDMIKEEGSFRETLSKGWLTSKILTETLSKFTGDLSESQLAQMGYTNEQIASIIKMGQTANDAATKVKTFTQLWDTLQEAAQSGWTKSWQLIIGDFNEAQELLTGISDVVSEFINASSDRRNNLLEGALLSNWGKLTKAINEAGVETTDFETKVKEVLFSRGRNSNKIIEQYGSIEKACKSGAISADILKEALNKLNNQVVDLTSIDEKLEVGSSGENVKKIQEALKSLDFNIGDSGIDGILGSATESAIKSFQEMKGFEITGIVDDTTLKALQEATSSTAKLEDNVFSLTDKVVELGGREKIIESFKNVFSALNGVVSPIKNALTDVFPPTTSEQLSGAIDKIHTFTKNLKVSDETADKIRRTFKGVFSAVDLFKKGLSAIVSPIGKFIGSGGLNGIANALLNVTASIGDFFTSLNDSFGVNSFFSTLSDGIFAAFRDVGSVIDSVLGKTVSFNDVVSFAKDGIHAFLEIVKNIAESDEVSKIFEKLGPIGEQVKKMCSVIKEQIGSFTGSELFGRLSNVRASIGEFYSSLKNTSDGKIDFSILLDKVSQKIKEIETVATSIPEKMESLGGAIATFASTVKSSALSAVDKLKEKMALLGETFISVKNKICDSASTIWENVKNLFALVGEKLSDNKVFSGLAIVGALAIVKKVISVFKSIRDFFSGNKNQDIREGITDVLDGMKKSLSAFTKSIKVASLVGIAAAIAILAVAMKQIASLQPDQIGESLIAIGLMLTELGVFLKITDGASPLKMGIGLLVMVMSLKKLIKMLNDIGTLNPIQFLTGIAGLGIVLLEISAFYSKMDKVAGKGLKTSVGIALMIFSLTRIAKALSKIGKMDLSAVGVGLAGIGGVLAEMIIVLAVLDKLNIEDQLVSCVALLVITFGLNKIASALKKLGSMSWSEIGRGLVAMGGALTELSAAIIAVSYFSGPLAIFGSGALYMTMMGLGDLASALKKLGSMSWSEIGRGLAAMGGALTELSAAIIAVSDFSGPLAVFGSGALYTTMMGLGDLADALQKFGSMSWDEIKNGLKAMGGALGETALGGVLNTFSGLGAGSISVMAKPLGDLADSVKRWTGVTVPEGLGDQLGTLATGIKAFNFAGWGADAIGKLVTPLGDLVSSVTKWTGVTVPEGLGDQLGTLAPGIKAFNFAGWGADAIGEMATPLGALADSIIKWVGVTVPAGLGDQLGTLAPGIKAFNFSGWGAEAISNLATPLGDLADSIIKWTGVTVPENLGNTMNELSVGIGAWNYIETGNIENVIVPLGDFADKAKLWNDVRISTLLPTTLSELADSVDAWNNISSDNIANVCISIESIGDVATKLSAVDFESISTQLNDFAASIGEINVSTDAFSNLGSNVVEKFQNAVSSGAGNATNAGKDLTNGIASGMASGMSTVSSAMSGIVSSVSGTVAKNKPVFLSAGKSLISSLASGMKNNAKTSVDAANNIANASAGKISSRHDNFYNAGAYLVLGFSAGIRSRIQTAANAAAEMASAATNAAKKTLDEHSPSKVFYSIGDFAGLGFVNGLSNYKVMSRIAGSGVAESAKDGLNAAIAKMTDSISNGVNVNPTIRPVLDLSSIESEAGKIGGIIGLGRSIGVTGNLSAISAMMHNRQNGTNNDDVVSAIGKLQKTLGNRTGDSYVINGITYDDGSNVSNAVKSLIKAARMERRG